MVYAHRGASAYRTENTMSAIELAIEQGADGIEIDVHLTRDGVVAVHHDETVERVFDGEGALKDLGYDELRRLRARNAPQDALAYVPTLDEVLARCASENITLNVELKTNIEPYPGIERAVIDAVARTGMRERVLYSSFNHQTLMVLRAIDPKARIGLLYSCIMVSPWRYALDVGANAIHPAKNSLTIPGLVRQCRENGVMVNVWTIDDPQLMRFCLDEGVDGIITNTPDVALSLI